MSLRVGLLLWDYVWDTNYTSPSGLVIHMRILPLMFALHYIYLFTGHMLTTKTTKTTKTTATKYPCLKQTHMCGWLE